MTFHLHLHIPTLSEVTLVTILHSFFNSGDKRIISESKTLLLIIEALSVAKHFAVLIIAGLVGESRNIRREFECFYLFVGLEADLEERETLPVCKLLYSNFRH